MKKGSPRSRYKPAFEGYPFSFYLDLSNSIIVLNKLKLPKYKGFLKYLQNNSLSENLKGANYLITILENIKDLTFLLIFISSAIYRR